MAYADTSVLLALFLNEPKTPDAWRWVNQQPEGVSMSNEIFIRNWQH